MQIAKLTQLFFHVVFFCGKFGNADPRLKFSKDDELSGVKCPAQYVLFTDEGGLSLSQCLFMCGLRDNCYGFFHNKEEGQCIGCRDKFPKSTNYPVSDGMVFYKAPLEYILTKYSLEKKNLNREQAKNNCMALGGQLAAFRSEEERKQIETNFLQSYQNLAMLWQDGYYIKKDEKFCWSDGTPVSDSYIKWGPDQPDFNDEPCVVFHIKYGFWASYDTVCNSLMDSVCEFDL